MLASYTKSLSIAFIVVAVAITASAQAGGNSTSITGTVLDPSGAVVPNATVELHNPVSAFARSTHTDSAGKFAMPNVPFNPYHLTVTGAGFSRYARDVQVRSSVPLNLQIHLQVEVSSTSVTVESAGDLVENDPTFHTDVERQLFAKMPLESQSSSLSSLVTLSSPGIAADSNGLFHGMGDHAENSFSVDGQPITDQQSKVFSNQVPLDSVQPMEVISGAPPAEYGDKTSVVINVTTRSGQGVTKPTGSVTSSYGSFGTSNVDFNPAYGGERWGNFIAANALNSGRFLDPPEFVVLHDKGNQENVFDRLDFQASRTDSLHLNLGFTRSWFQNPNSYDQELHPGQVNPLTGSPLGSTDQRSQIRTFNIAPSWTRVLSNTAVFTLGGFIRRDAYNYYPSANPFADIGPPSLQRESVGQNRTLGNAGIRSSVSYVKGIHNLKAGGTYQQTFLTENDGLGIVDYTLNAPCLTAPTASNPNVPVLGFISAGQCAAAGLQANVASNPNAPNSSLYPLFNPVLLPFDLTRGGGLFSFHGHTDVKELSLYIEDTITKGNWTANLVLRGDLYNGLTVARQAEPRLGVAYDIKRTNTVLSASYARTLETPFNENLLISSTGCNFALLSALVPCVPAPLSPGYRNEFHVGLQQAFGKYLVFSGEYVWKYTHNGYDFSDLGNTPIFFPIEWHNSKIPGFAGRVSMPNFHGLSALFVFSSVSARFFTPQVGGLGAIPAVAGSGSVPFRIDHDERFNQTAHFQYQPKPTLPWIGFNWRYDSGLVAGASPCFGIASFNTCPGSVLISGIPNVSMVAANVGAVPLTADQEFQAGFFCGTQHATPTQALPFNCPAAQFGSTLIQVPVPGSENDDRNPPRIQPRSLFDVAVGADNLFHGDHYKWSLQFTVLNLTNKYALYNSLSTFSGTHYVSPRSYTAELGFHF